MSDKYAALKQAAEKATPGPWKMATDWERAAVFSLSKEAFPEYKRVVCSGNQNNHKRWNTENWSGADWIDAEFIAAANPATILELLAERDADKARIAELELRLSQQQSAASNNLDMFRRADARIAELLERRERDKQGPVRYMNRFTGACYTLAQQPDAATDTAVYVPLFDAPQPAPVAQPVQVQDERASYESFVEQRLGDCVDSRRAKNGDQGYMAWDMAMGWIVWQGRAAMLKHQSSIQVSDSASSGEEIKQPASNGGQS